MYATFLISKWKLKVHNKPPPCCLWGNTGEYLLPIYDTRRVHLHCIPIAIPKLAFCSTRLKADVSIQTAVKLQYRQGLWCVQRGRTGREVREEFWVCLELPWQWDVQQKNQVHGYLPSIHSLNTKWIGWSNCLANNSYSYISQVPPLINKRLELFSIHFNK